MTPLTRAGAPEGAIADAAALLDPERLTEFAEISRDYPGLIREIAGAYLDDTPRRFGALYDAVRAGDPALVRQQAHALKGIALQLGATVLADLSRSIEYAAAAGHCEEGVRLLPSLEAEHRLLRPVLERWRATGVVRPRSGGDGGVVTGHQGIA